MRSRNALVLVVALTLGCGDKKADENSPAVNKPIETAEPTLVRVTGIPDENPTELARSYKPLTDYLAEKLGAKVEYVPVTDYGAAVHALAAGKVDFAWLGGFTHVQSRNMTSVVPLVQRDIDRQFYSVFIASKKSAIKNPGDLKGRTFAFGSKSSTSGHLMPRHFLTTVHKIDSDKDFDGKPVFSGAHDATAKMVEEGKVAAGALNKQVWDRLVSEGKIETTKVDVIWTTPPYVDYVWTARREVSEELREKFAQAFLALDPKTAAHQPILDRMGAKKYVRATAADFDSIEAVGKQTGLLK